MENNLLRRVCKPLLLILFFCAQAAKADNLCEVSFIQNNAELKPEMKSGWAVINLQKMPFDLVISPKECATTFATLTHPTPIAQLVQLPEVVFAGTGYGYAGSVEDADVLHWPSRPNILTTLREITSDWKDIDAYKAEEKLLGYQLPVIQTFGSGWVFNLAGDKAVASFRRLTQAAALNAQMPNIQLPAVAYLNIKDLLKPTYHNATAAYQLIKPYKIIFVFQ